MTAIAAVKTYGVDVSAAATDADEDSDVIDKPDDVLLVVPPPPPPPHAQSTNTSPSTIKS